MDIKEFRNNNNREGKKRPEYPDEKDGTVNSSKSKQVSGEKEERTRYCKAPGFLCRPVYSIKK